MVRDNLLVGCEGVPLNLSISWHEVEQTVSFAPDVGERLNWAGAKVCSIVKWFSNDTRTEQGLRVKNHAISLLRVGTERPVTEYRR